MRACSVSATLRQDTKCGFSQSISEARVSLKNDGVRKSKPDDRHSTVVVAHATGASPGHQRKVHMSARLMERATLACQAQLPHAATGHALSTGRSKAASPSAYIIFSTTLSRGEGGPASQRQSPTLINNASASCFCVSRSYLAGEGATDRKTPPRCVYNFRDSLREPLRQKYCSRDVERRDACCTELQSCVFW